MGSHGDTVLDSGGPLPVQPNCAAALLFSQQEAHAILPPRSGCVRARCELFGRSQLWPKKPTFKRKTGRSDNGMVRPCSCPASQRSWQGGAKDKEHAMSQTPNTAIAVIGIDIGKNSFHVVGHDARGAIVLRQKWSRGQVEARLANIPPCLIGMEACVGAHHLSRKLASLGHDARLMPAKYVRPYSKGQKNDFNDAEAIAEAVQRPTMKFVATKT